MRAKGLQLFSVTLGLGLALGVAQALVPERAAGAVRYAAPAASGVGDCSSWADACALRTALANAVDTDQIWVKAGVHVPGTLRTDSFALKTGVAVYGGFAGTESALGERDATANATILSGDIDGNDSNDDGNFIAETSGQIVGSNSYHVLVGGGTTSAALLNGFVVTAGQANGPWPANGGGGMDIRSGHPTLTNVRFSGNYGASGGGAIYMYLSNPAISNATFTGNLAAGDGGGVYVENGTPTFTKATFVGNQAGSDGAGMYTYWGGHANLVDCDFVANAAAARGGGMYNDRTSNPALTRVRFLGNTAADGGGMMNFDQSAPTLVNVLFSGNSASNNGGGLTNDWSSPTLTNVTFSGNSAVSGGGIYNRSGSNPVLANALLWGNTASSAGNQIATVEGADLPIVSFSDVQGCGGSGVGWDPLLGSDGGGNIDANPLFLDANGIDDTLGTADDNLRLPGGSPAVNAGKNAAVPAGVTTDLARKPRISGDRVDIGAHEFQFSRLTFRSQGGNDGWVLESGEGTNVGGALNASGGTVLVGDDLLDRQYRALLSFDTTVLPETAVLTKVTLHLKLQDFLGTNPFGTHGNLLVDIRKGAFGTAAGLQIGDFQAPASAPGVGSIPKLPVLGWHTKVWKSGVFANVNKAGLTQLRLRFAKDDNDDRGADCLRFFSGNAALTARPQLSVEYYVPKP